MSLDQPIVDCYDASVRPMNQMGLIMKLQVIEARVPRGEDTRMGSEMVVAGAIVDSWYESARTAVHGARLVLQVAPKGQAERPGHCRGGAVFGSRPMLAGRPE